MKKADMIPWNNRDISALAKQDGITVDAYVAKMARLEKEDKERTDR